MREAKIADADAIGRLHAISWINTYRGLLPDAYLDGNLQEERQEHWQKKLRSLSAREFVYLSEEEDSLQGFICVLDEPYQYYEALIDNLHVMPEMKGRGIGSLLLDTAVAELRRTKRMGFYLWVIEGNIAAENFYRRKGGRRADSQLFELGGAQIMENRFVWEL